MDRGTTREGGTPPAGSARTPGPVGKLHPVSDDRLEFRGIHRRFSRLRVLRGVDGVVDPSHPLLSITGSNGSGKSTLLRCLAGLEAPQRGRIDLVVDGRSLPVSERRRAIGWVAPDLELYPELTVAENLEFFARLRRTSAAGAVAWLEELGVPGDRPAGALSSGMRQRLRWAWATLGSPRVLLLDEPFQNLDEEGRVRLLEVLDRHLHHGLAIVANPEPLELPHAGRHLHLDR